MTCHSCGAELKAGKKFCAQCGIQVISPSLLAVQHAVTCPQCGTALKEGQKFCVSCGTRVSPPSPQPLYSETSCGQCGASLKTNARFCSSCGAVTGQSPSPPRPSLDAGSPTPSVIRQVTEVWELPPWPRGLVPPPPPLSGAIHTFSIPGNVARAAISGLDVSGLLSGSQLGTTFMGIKKTCEPIFAELSRIVSAFRSLKAQMPPSPTVKRADDPVKTTILSQPARRCPNCHQAVAADKKFCTGCGLLRM